MWSVSARQSTAGISRGWMRPDHSALILGQAKICRARDDRSTVFLPSLLLVMCNGISRKEWDDRERSEALLVSVEGQMAGAFAPAPV